MTIVITGRFCIFPVRQTMPHVRILCPSIVRPNLRTITHRHPNSMATSSEQLNDRVSQINDLSSSATWRDGTCPKRNWCAWVRWRIPILSFCTNNFPNCTQTCVDELIESFSSFKYYKLEIELYLLMIVGVICTPCCQVTFFISNMATTP